MFYNTSVSGGLVPRQFSQSPDGYHHSTIATLMVQVGADLSELRRNLEEGIASLEGFQAVAETAAGVLGIGLGVEAVRSVVVVFFLSSPRQPALPHSSTRCFKV